MAIINVFQDWISQIPQQFIKFSEQFLWFIFWTILLVLLGIILLWLLQFILNRWAPKVVKNVYQQVIRPINSLIHRTGFLIIFAVTINVFEKDYSAIYNFLHLIVYLILTITTAWLLSRLVRQILRSYGILLIQQISKEANDFILVGETIANVVIGLLAALFFAQSQKINLISILTGFGIGGIAVAFAAREILSQLIGTILLYLDRPYVPGEYIRANFNFQADDIYGRIESIGIRSTKIRLAAKNTLLIAPNSLMARMDVENISRGTKVMVLLYIDFAKVLSESERVFVSQVLDDSINGLLGVEPGSIRIVLFEPDQQGITRARVSFFLLSSSTSSLNLRKQLVNMANETIAKRLTENQLEFSMEEPMLYVDSPIPK